MKGSLSVQGLKLFPAKEVEFKFPNEDIFKYVPIKDAMTIKNNVYKEYSDECLVDGIRSKSERLFERFCVEHADWYYKNGDQGQSYFSIVYLDGNQNQHLFFADYIVQIKGKIWIIETNGGQSDYGDDKNIDINVSNKFDAFKIYAEKNNISWGFVRDRFEKLYINNTEYSKDMNDEAWKPLITIIP